MTCFCRRWYDVALGMGVDVGEVGVVDAEDVAVREVVVDVNGAVVTDLDVDGVKALVMGGVVLWWRNGVKKNRA